MFIDLLSESCEEGGNFSIGNEDEPIFRGYVLPDQHEFLVIFYKCFSKDKLIGLEMPLLYWSYLGSVRQKSIVMVIKHHTYTHCTFRLSINAQTFQHLPVNKM